VAVSKQFSCAKYILHRYYGKYFLLGFLYDNEIDGASIDRLHTMYQTYGYVKYNSPFEGLMKNILNTTGQTIKAGEPVIATPELNLQTEISNLKKAISGLSEKNRDLKRRIQQVIGTKDAIEHNCKCNSDLQYTIIKELKDKLAKQQVMLSNLTWHMKSCTQVCQHTKDIIEKMDKVINEE
jgi:hypothetical protein